MSMFDINTIASVYCGERGGCCGGCAGEHTYSSQHRARASEKRGYEIPDSEINDGVVKMVLAKIEANKRSIDLIHPGFVSCEIGDQVYIAYFAM